MHVRVTRRFPGDEVDQLRPEHDVVVWEEDRPMTAAELHAFVGGADAAIVMLTDRVDAAFFDACPNLRVVATAAVGYDNIDVAEATRRGVLVGNTPGVLTDATADLTWALILATARRVVEAAAAVHAGEWTTWAPGWMCGMELAGSTLGIVGMGAIGTAVARRAEGFGMEVISSRPLPLEEVLARADVVSVHVPLRDSTRGLIGTGELRRMKRSAILVNTARGPIVDQRALTIALADGWIAGAGLDVVEVEPIPPDDPLLDVPTCLVLPHIGSATVTTRRRMMRLAVANVRAALAGEPMPAQVLP